MTFGQCKKSTYALIDEYSSEESNFTEDEDLASKINLIANICYHELSGIKPIRRIVAIDRSSKGTVEYNRAYDLPSDMKMLSQIVAYDEDTNMPINAEYEIQYGVAEIENGVTTYKNKIYINDLAKGNYFIKYEALPTDITEDTPDSFELELDKDIQVLMPFAIASDILKSDVSSDYTTFENRYRDLLTKLDVRKSRGTIVIPNTTTSSINF